MSWLSRFVNAINPRRLDEDLDEELRDHLERRAAALVEKGVPREEANRLTRSRFGNMTRWKEASRDYRLSTFLESTLGDIRYAWRGMRRAPAFSVTAVLSLALAIGAITAVYSIVDAAILRPLPVYKPAELFSLSWPDIQDPGTPAGEEREFFSYPEYLRFATAAQPVARLAIFGSASRVEAQDSNPGAPIEKLNRAYVSGKSFDLLGVTPALGRLFSAEEDNVPPHRAVAVLSYDYWRRRFGSDPAVVGRQMTIDGTQYEVIGVARNGFSGVEPGTFVDAWLPAASFGMRMLNDSGWHMFRIIGRLMLGAMPEQVQARIQPPFHNFQVERVKLFATMPAAIKKQFMRSVIHVHSCASGVSAFRNTFSRSLWIVFGVALGILLIACANVASLLLARATARAPEMAMRVSLGAARVRLARQMLTESLMLSLLAGALGALLAWALGPLLVRLLSKETEPVQLALAVGTRMLLFCIGVSSVSAVLFGLVPAWQSSDSKPMLLLRTFSGGQAGKLRLGKLFVSLQVACAFCLVVVGAAFLLSLNNLLRVDPGFNASDVAVLTVATDSKQAEDPVAWAYLHPDGEARVRNLMFQLQSRVESQPGIESAALAMWPIFQGGGWSQQVIVPGKGPSEREEIFYRVSPHYFATLRTALVAGRDFRTEDSSARQLTPAIVNEAFARKYFDGRDAVGREFSYPFVKSSFRRQTIVGVVADAHYYDLRTRPDPIVYLPTEGNNSFTLYVRSPLPLRQVVRVVDREAQPLGSGMRVHEVTTMDTIVGETLTREKVLAGVGGAFAFFGLLLASIGLFGLLNYSVGRRTKELGIRTALGARQVEIVLLILRDGGGLLSAGLATGLVAGLSILAILRTLLFGIQRADPVVIGISIGLFLLTVSVAAGFPAHRAASVDPMSVLREE